MIIPETILYNTLQNFLYITIKDYNDNKSVDETCSILYRIFKNDDNGDEIKLDNFKYYEQAVAILTKNVESTRKIHFNIGYNMQRMNTPTVHILMPNENKGVFDSITSNEEDKVELCDNNQKLFVDKSRTSKSTYYLMITSDNSNEVMIVYYWLKAMFLLFLDQLSLNGLLNLSHAGQDINLQQDLAPANVFHRNLSLTFDYESNVSMKIDKQIITGIKFGTCNQLNEKYQEFILSQNK